ncbi:DUF1015 family protein [Mucilaginibacter sp. BJC16-A38]|uniref:DUF1015 family protein n=1 Tax=Mucilaginibacter phenanthrenivorans TaxID=1234842 RepID=UPI00215768BF|nr:DUF1015 family protein [Mucilaginibacter phenanthrenivorans]MCR8560132.1 DUF1015 family protein [Mucilaginibacter phenanthrenivorans]
MAKISPFRAIHPNPFYADQLVFTKPQAESVAGNTTLPGALPPLKTLLETGARQRPETPEGQAMAYEDINATLAHLLESERLWLDRTPCIYVYEVTHPAYTQTGIWAMTALDDAIKTHELTFQESVRRLKNYREHTGLEGSPILLTYPPEPVIANIITEAKQRYPDVRFESSAGIHQLWKIAQPELIERLVNAFANVSDVYLADGHHRKRSAELLLAEQISNNKPAYDTISALYMSTAELKIRQYNRVVIPEQPVSKEWLFRQLLPNFYMQESFNNKPVQPAEERRMGMYMDGIWLNLTAKPKTYVSDNNATTLDVSILQDYILAPLFNIRDPRTDQRLRHTGGEKAKAEMEALIQAHPYAIGFTLCPLTVDQLTRAADAGINLPPKSTWIDPKVPYGLILYQHETI